MMKIDIDFVESFDGTKLLVRRFHAAEQSRQRTLMIVHGLAEHSGRYEHVGMHCANLGWNVIAADLRGHGQSEGPRMHADRFEDFCKDLETLRNRFELKPEQLSVAGHSMGGLIAARDAQLHPQARSRLVLLSPFLGMIRQPPIWKLMVGRAMSLIAPRTLFSTGITAGETTNNPAAAAQRAYDPLSSEQISARLFFECQQALSDVWEQLKRIQNPTLLYQSADDLLVNAESAMNWLTELQKTCPEPCSGQLFPGHKHELLNEADWPETCQSILNWLEEEPAQLTEAASRPEPGGIASSK